MYNTHKIDDLKKQLDKYLPLPKETIKSWQENFITDFTYNSNAIEGNTLSLRETSVVINEGIAIGGKTIREHLELINHKEAYLYVEELAKQNAFLSEKNVKDLHYRVLNHEMNCAGTYRRVPVVLRGAEFRPIQPDLIEKAIDNLFIKYKEEWNDKHVLWRIAMFHLEFESIHPFIDGNGRTGRLIINLELLKNGYLPVIIKFIDRAKYFKAFSVYNANGNGNALFEIICNELEKQYDLLLKLGIEST